MLCPFGRGQQYFSGTNRLLDEAIGGWKLSTSIVSYSGFPETITGPNNNSQSISGVYRVNQYRPLHVKHRSNENWFGDDPSAAPCTSQDPTSPDHDNGLCAFGAPLPNAFGTESNGAVRGPGFFNTDLSAFKDFHIIGEHTVGFRFDAFNAFNIVSYGNPDTSIGDGNFGNVSLQTPRSTERHLQFSQGTLSNRMAAVCSTAAIPHSDCNFRGLGAVFPLAVRSPVEGIGFGPHAS